MTPTWQVMDYIRKWKICMKKHKLKLKSLKCLIKSSQNDPEDSELLLINRDVTSVRQLSEWGMRMIQGGFPRIKDCIKYEEEGDRKIIFMLIVLLSNFKTKNISINTILHSNMETRDEYYDYEAISEYANDFYFANTLPLPFPQERYL